MNPILRITISALALAGGLALGTPAQARTDCSSNASLWHVHRRLDGAIDQLQHDQRDYGGHRVSAINDLQSARNEIVAAEQYAENVDHENGACFQAHGPTGGSDANWGTRGQGGSNRDVWTVRSWTERMIDQLQRDQHDYGGHRVNAIRDMQAAREQLVAAEGYAKSRGY